MKYQGSKLRIGKRILEFIKPDSGKFWVEPFVGGCGMMRHVSGNKIGSDANSYLIEFLKGLQGGWIPPKSITREEWYHIKGNKELYDPMLVGYAGIAGSYGGCWFAAYSGPNSTGRDYLLESYKSALKLAPLISDVNFINSDYKNLEIPSESIIYCDPPYKGTRSYYNHHKVDYDEFWQWCRNKKAEGHKVYISEYQAPDDFIDVMCIDTTTVMANSSSKKVQEKLFTPK